MKKVSDIGEFGLIEQIKKAIDNKILGSDTAPIKIDRGTYLVTCDIVLEGRHFLRSYPADAVGFKAISVNVSDIVASGGKPKFALISLLLPDLELSYINRLYRGILNACKKYHCVVAGGNVVRSEKLAVDVFMIGRAKKFVARGELKIGDSIFVSGVLGDSRAGRELLGRKKSKLETFEKVLIARHLNPTIDLKIADYIASYARSSLDVSDGLAGDLYHLKGKNKIRVDIDSKKIPLSKELILFCKKYKRDPVKYALLGGEDYKIIFAQKNGRSPFPKIGRVEKGNGIFVDNTILLNKGFDHFK